MKRKTFNKMLNTLTYGTWLPYTAYYAYKLFTDNYKIIEHGMITKSDIYEMLSITTYYTFTTIGTFYAKETIKNILKHSGQTGNNIKFNPFKNIFKKDYVKNDIKTMFGQDNISKKAKTEFLNCKEILKANLKPDADFQRTFSENFAKYLKTKCELRDFEEKYGFTYNFYKLLNIKNIRMYFSKNKKPKNKKKSLEMLLDSIENHSINQEMYSLWKKIKNTYPIRNEDIIDSLIKEYSGYKIRDKNKEIKMHLRNRLAKKEINPFSKKKRTYSLAFAPMDSGLYVMKISDKNTIEKEAVVMTFLNKITKKSQSQIKIPKIIEKASETDNESEYHIIMQSMHGAVLKNYLQRIDVEKRMNTVWDLISSSSKFFREAYQNIKSLTYEIEEIDYTYELNENIYNSKIKNKKELRSEIIFFFDELNNLPKTLIHGDFHPENVIFWRDFFSIIDFENTAIGNDFTDACCMLEQPWDINPEKMIDKTSDIFINEREEYHINKSEIKRIILKNSCYEDLSIFLKMLRLNRKEKPDPLEWMKRAVTNFKNYLKLDISKNDEKQAERIIKIITKNQL